jgi:hypothetical protein
MIWAALSAGVSAQDSPEQIWESANRSYTVGDYPQAIAAYDSIRTQGYASARLYFNLGNAYYKDSRIGRAILYYNKALRLAPSDDNIRHNLAVANTFVRDRIETVPEFFVKTWARQLMVAAGGDTWTVLFLVFLGIALALTLVYLFAVRLGLRKAGFYGAAASLLLAAGSAGFASIQRKKLLHPDQAVIMLTAAPVKSEPNNAGRDMFILHEGTLVRVVGETGDWREIVVADGNSGWIDVRSIELID